MDDEFVKRATYGPSKGIDHILEHPYCGRCWQIKGEVFFCSLVDAWPCYDDDYPKKFQPRIYLTWKCPICESRYVEQFSDIVALDKEERALPKKIAIKWHLPIPPDNQTIEYDNLEREDK